MNLAFAIINTKTGKERYIKVSDFLKKKIKLRKNEVVIEEPIEISIKTPDTSYNIMEGYWGENGIYYPAGYHEMGG